MEEAVRRFGTPQYLFSWQEVENAYASLETLSGNLPVKHWLSFKTMPLRPLVRRWKRLGTNIEVVSPFELYAAAREGYPPEAILINGVAKHEWLGTISMKGLKVHFDSMAEVRELAPLARKLRWVVGIRLRPSVERDPDEPNFGTQFGLIPDEVEEALSILDRFDVKAEGVHFHLRSNVPSAEEYSTAIIETSNVCHRFGWSPTYLDCGGGFPANGERDPEGQLLAKNFDLEELGQVLTGVPEMLPSVQEIWFENGRYLLSAAGALVVRVKDIKDRPECRYLICDGGRTNHALVSDWEIHDVDILPARHGAKILTTICGPTCMAFDRLRRVHLPSEIEVGDVVVWHNAGAYHLPWETRFSFGRATVIWEENGQYTIARSAESLERWWSEWE